MKNSRLFSIISAIVFMLLTMPAVAELFSRLAGKVVYDSDLNITWLANGNLAESNTFGIIGFEADGSMSWNNGEPQAWLTAMNDAFYLGISDWRFPATVHPDSTCSNTQPNYSAGTDCIGSEMGHLYYTEFGLAAFESIGLGTVVDIGPFKNVRNDTYWSGTSANGGRQYTFSFASGGQTNGSTIADNYAWPVVDGDVFITLLRCDLNDNGEIDAGDILRVMRMTLGDIADDLDCDINNNGFGDGDVSIADLVVLYRIVLGVIPPIYN